jgi:hypothetical protein
VVNSGKRPKKDLRVLKVKRWGQNVNNGEEWEPIIEAVKVLAAPQSRTGN